jgi:hypothetical protein
MRSLKGLRAQVRQVAAGRNLSQHLIHIYVMSIAVSVKRSKRHTCPTSRFVLLLSLQPYQHPDRCVAFRGMQWSGCRSTDYGSTKRAIDVTERLQASEDQPKRGNSMFQVVSALRYSRGKCCSCTMFGKTKKDRSFLVQLGYECPCALLNTSTEI